MSDHRCIRHGLYYAGKFCMTCVAQDALICDWPQESKRK